MITAKSIGTLVVFIFSIVCVIYPIPSRKSRIKLDLTTAPILSIALLWAAQCLGRTQIRTGILGVDGVKPYNILLLFFSLAYMAVTLDISGVLQAAAFWVSNKGGSNGYKLYFYFYLMLTILSIAVGNDPVILSGTVFLAYYTEVVRLDPVAWIIAEFAAANTASMVLFVGNPTNVVICEGFRINQVAFTAYTIFPFLACSLTCFIALGVQFRHPKYLPRRLNATPKLDVRSALVDPLGAWVGSILLATCLLVIVVVSFFNVDVWMISLPFAVTKFVYDLGYDYYRFINGIPRKMPPASPAIAAPSPENGKPPEHPSPDSHGSKEHHFPPSQMTPAVTEETVVDNVNSASAPVTAETPVEDRLASCKVRLSTRFPILSRLSSWKRALEAWFDARFPTVSTAIPRLPFALVPFAFSQFILIEALARQGWIEVFATWLVRASHRNIFPSIWLIGVLGIIMCNISGTNIGATILLTKVVRAAQFPPHTARAAGIALALASNIGAVSFTYSASLAGLLWYNILDQKHIPMRQRTFAFWNLLPLFVMTVVGLGVVSAEMAVLY